MRIIDLKELALKKVKINGDVIGKFGTFEIEQTFINNTKEVLEVGYTFPIVETATIVGFEVDIGDKVLKGKCKEKGEAKKEYQQNLVNGNSAYLMEEKTDNSFLISIGKLDINEEVKVKILYIDKFEITDNKIKILIPTLVTPRYKSDVTSILAYGNVDYTVDFNININKSLNRKSIDCISHQVKIIDEENNEKVQVLNYDLSKDFKMDIELKNELSSNAIKSKTKDGKDMIYLAFMPEILDTYEDSEKEYVFVIDISGSMAGEKIDETKKAVIECLKQLDVGDKFNIIAFESSFEVMNIRAIEYNEENMEKAIKYINSLRPRGGTEILNPIKFALYEKDCDKIVLLFTDGQVGNENQIINYVEENINRSRIFTFGIDSNVNSYFIKKLAQVGNGKAELIQPKEKIDEKIIRTFARIQTPLLEDVKVNYGINKVIDEIKEEKCLFNYEFFNVFTKIEKLEDDIELRGKILNKEYIWKINKDNIVDTGVDLEILFAKMEIDRLEEYIRNAIDYEKKLNYENMIVEISEKYNINSKYTSFITVYEREDKLFEVPKYQETVLSNRFMNSSIRRSEYMFNMKCTKDVSIDSSLSSFDDIDIPSFLRKNKRIAPSIIIQDIYENNSKILTEKVKEYYEKFINQEEKSILTYVLYALYYMENNYIFNYNDFLLFLENNKDTIFSNETYMNLVYACYTSLKEDRLMDKNKTFELLNEDYKKIAYTNLKVKIDLIVLSDIKIKKIIEENKIEENINDIIWYLTNSRNLLSVM